MINSATVLVFEKPPALWVKHWIISFPFFRLLAMDLISFRNESVVTLKGLSLLLFRRVYENEMSFSPPLKQYYPYLHIIQRRATSVF